MHHSTHMKLLKYPDFSIFQKQYNQGFKSMINFKRATPFIK